MTVQPLDLAIPRFKSNEDRFNTLLNGGDTESFRNSSGVDVPSVRKALKAMSDAGNVLLAAISSDASGILSGATTQAGNASTAAAAAQAFRDAAQTYRDQAQAAAASVDASNKLDKNANLSDLTDAAAALTHLGVSAFIKTLLDDADAASALTTLGFSTFGKSLVNKADAAAFQTAMGISAFVKTLLDDADAGAAQTTLGISAFVKTLLDDGDAATFLSTLGLTVVTQAEAEAGTASNNRLWTALRVKQAIAANATGAGVGISQTWQNVLSSRAGNTAYQNTTGKPIQLAVSISDSTHSASSVVASTDGSTWATISPNANAGVSPTTIRHYPVIPAGHYYKVQIDSGVTIGGWAELR